MIRKKEAGRKRRWRDKVSLRGALILTTLVCLIGGVSACLAELSLLNQLNNNIYDTYVHVYLPERKEQYFYVENGAFVRLEKDLPQ